MKLWKKNFRSNGNGQVKIVLRDNLYLQNLDDQKEHIKEITDTLLSVSEEYPVQIEQGKVVKEAKIYFIA